VVEWYPWHLVSSAAAAHGGRRASGNLPGARAMHCHGHRCKQPSLGRIQGEKIAPFFNISRSVASLLANVHAKPAKLSRHRCGYLPGTTYGNSADAWTMGSSSDPTEGPAPAAKRRRLNRSPVVETDLEMRETDHEMNEDSEICFGSVGFSLVFI